MGWRTKGSMPMLGRWWTHMPNPMGKVLQTLIPCLLDSTLVSLWAPVGRGGVSCELGAW